MWPQWGFGIYTGLVPALVLINVPHAATNTFAIIIGAVSAAAFIIYFVLTGPRWSAAPAKPAVPASNAYSAT